MDTKKLYSFVINPWVVVGCLVAGVTFGMTAPGVATSTSTC
jgi:hypothetical protein